MKSKKEILAAEAAAEKTVLAELESTPMYAIEIEPRTGQTREEIKGAVERCEAMGWIRIGPAHHYDPRAHIREAGRAELARRRSHDH